MRRSQTQWLVSGLKIFPPLMLAMPALCFANITVSPMKVTLNEQHATTVVISSKSETTQYIQGKSPKFTIPAPQKKTKRRHRKARKIAWWFHR